MLQSIMVEFFKSLWLLAKLAALVAVAVYFHLHPGTVIIDWQDFAFELSMAMAVLLAIVVIIFFAVVYNMWRRFIDLPRYFREFNRVKNLNRGYEAITKGLLAVAASDKEMAKQHTKRAEALLPDRALTRLLTAQTAGLVGDELKAQKSYQALLDDPEVSFFGIRGLLTKALNDNDLNRALIMAREAYKEQPERDWVLTTLFELEARTRHWDEARKILFKVGKFDAMPKDTIDNHHAALLTAEGMDAQSVRDYSAALKAVVKAYRHDPDFAPAYTVAAECLIEQDKERAAKKTIKAGWENCPHPDLYQLWLRLGPNHPLEKVKWVEKLVEVNPNRYQSHIALTRSALDANLWGVARTHLQYAEAVEPRQGTYKLLAQLEKLEGKNPDREAKWLEKAANAGPDKQWICRETGETFKQWHPIQPVTKKFNTIIWDVPRHRSLTPAKA